MSWYSAFLVFVTGSQVASCMTNQEQYESIKNLQKEVYELKEKPNAN